MDDRLLIAAITYAVAAGLSWLFVAKTIPLSHRWGIVDLPGPRRAHRVPMARAGGVPLYLAFAVAVAVTFSLGVDRLSLETERLLILLVASGFLCLVMVYDDVAGLSPPVKLAWQLSAALLVVAPRLRGEGHGLVIDSVNLPFGTEHLTLPTWFALVFTVVWLIGMTNAMNLLDGVDGLAGSVTLVACAILFLHTVVHPQFTISLLPAALAGAVSGYLPFNWHPAKIIMGDAGANFLGFTLAGIAIIGGAKIATTLLAFGLPVLDVVWLILFRIAHRRSPFAADRSHLHYRLADAGLKPPQVVLFVSGCSLAFGIAALLLPTREAKAAAIVGVGLLLLATVTVLTVRERHRPPSGPPAAWPDAADPTR